eukprot:278064-Hanusia_phi.AAC.1
MPVEDAGIRAGRRGLDTRSLGCLYAVCSMRKRRRGEDEVDDNEVQVAFTEEEMDQWIETSLFWCIPMFFAHFLGQ